MVDIIKKLKLKISVFGSLRTKLLLSYLLFIILPYTIMGFYQISQISRSVMEQTIKTEETDMLQLNQNIKNFLDTILVISDDVYFDKGIWEYFTSKYDNHVESAKGFYELIQPRINQYKSIRTEITNVTIFTNKPDMLKNGDEIADLSEGTREWEIYQKALKNPYNYFWESKKNNEGMKIISMYRILNLNNYFIGMLKISFKESKLRDFIKEQLSGNEVYIVSPDKIVMSSTRSGLINGNADSIGFDLKKNDGYVDTRDVEVDGVKIKAISSEFTLGNNTSGRWTIIKTVPTNRILGVVNHTRNLQSIILLITCLLIIVLAVVISGSMSKRIKQLTNRMKKVQNGDFTVSVDFQEKDEIGYLGTSFNTMVKKLNELVGQVYHMQLQQKDMQIKKREAELYALQNQINPHFLFNTLDAILLGIKEDRDETAKVIQLLAKSFRRIIRKSDDSLFIKDELEFIEDYLEIQKFRMLDKLSWSIDVPEDLLSVKIPKLTIQPLVENAIYHGISMKKGNGTVKINVKYCENKIIMSVEDDGIGIAWDNFIKLQESLEDSSVNTSGVHVGLKNVYDRIKLYYGEDGTFEINSVYGEGTQVRIAITTKINMEVEPIV